MAGLGNLLGSLLGGSRKGGGELGNVLGSVFGRSGGNSSTLTTLLPVVVGMLSRGGLGKILSGFQAQGLSKQADSWVAKGRNKAVSGDQVSKAVGADKIAEIAKKLGVSNSEAASSLAKLLPKVIDHVTPGGSVPAGKKVDSALEKLRKAAVKA